MLLAGEKEWEGCVGGGGGSRLGVCGCVEREGEGCVGGEGGSRPGVCGCVVRVACCRQLPAASRSPASQAFAAVGCA